MQKRENFLLKYKSLRERIKTIFKKYGLTITAIELSVAAIITSTILNLTSGIKSVLKVFGNGLKDISKKIENLLPGMIGAISSFIFKIAEETISFLAKNACLLILAAVIYFVEQFKKKNK